MLSTIGYEGSKATDFIQTLKVAEVEVVIDVRDRAQSRLPGFSKSALEEQLAKVGIQYFHFRQLGDPKEGRDAARANDMPRFREIFSAVLETAAAKEAIQEIADISRTKAACLLCFERDPAHCHRTMVADRITQLTGEKARQLGVRKFEPAS